MTRIALSDLRSLVEQASLLSDRLDQPLEAGHPFEQRGFAGVFPEKVRRLFDDGHFAEAAFTALKYFDRFIQRHSGSVEIGKKLMMAAFQENVPLIKMGDLSTETGRNLQEGFKFLCAGAVLYLRNPRGHEVEMPDTPDDCLGYLGVIATLVREMTKAGYE